MSFVPHNTNLVSMLLSSVQKHSDRPLFGTNNDTAWQWTTYEQFSAMVDSCRAGLKRLGIMDGDVVAVISNNRIEWAVAAHATWGLSAIYVPISPVQLEKEWSYILNDSNARVCFVANHKINDRVQAMQADLLELEYIINFNGEMEDDTSYVRMMEYGSKHPVASTVPAPQQVATIFYTTSSQGNPRGVQLTHLNLTSNCSALLEISDVNSEDRSLAFLPWSNVLGGAIEMNSLIMAGASMAICGRPDKLSDYLPETNPSVLYTVPYIWNRFYNEIRERVESKSPLTQAIFHNGIHARLKKKRNKPLTLAEKTALALAEKMAFPKIREYFGGNLRYVSCGGAALSRGIRTMIDELDVTVYEGYGLTETSGCATTNGLHGNRPGSVGKPIPGVAIQLDNHVPGAAKGEGEVIIYGMGTMAGYHNMPEATVGAFTEDGGYRSGDLGRMDEDGFLYITGRVKELYKLTNGRYVAPAPLEEKLQESPFISQCMIYGANEKHNVALIVPDLGSVMMWAKSNGLPPFIESVLKDPRTYRMLEDEIAKHSSEFKSFERIRRFEILNEIFTPENDLITPTQKLRRSKIIEMYKDSIQNLYSIPPISRT